MPTVEHGVVKPEKLVNTAVGMLEQELIIPRLFQREGIDQFRGAKDDTVNVKVEGVLPFHDYEWRSGSTTSTTPGTRQAITFDLYNERTYPVTFGGNVYSAVAVTDEQVDMDIDGWGKLLAPQSKAIARGLNRRCVEALTTQTYAVTIGHGEENPRGAIVEARRVLNAFHVPAANRYLLVGTDWESLLLLDDKMALAQNVGDGIAASALQDATIGRRYGFNIVVDETIPSDEAYAFAGNAFILATAAPYVPSSVGAGASTSFEGFALRWMRDYDALHLTDRSVVNTYAGVREVLDVLVGWDGGSEVEVISADEHFVRGIKLDLTANSDYPAAASELATITGISDAKVFNGANFVAEGSQ